MSLQHVVNVYIQKCERLRCLDHMEYTESKKKSICVELGNILERVWHALGDAFHAQVPSFITVCASVLYLMRRGLAYQGTYVIPMCRFLARALPGECPCTTTHERCIVH